MTLTTEWPTAILHIDGDAFFASVIAAIEPTLAGKPLVVGAERGIATAYSYEAKRLGVTRGMPIFEVRQRFPTIIIRSSDYRTYDLFSKKMFQIVSKYSPVVERYSIDEMFADVSPVISHYKNYEQLAELIKQEVENSLDISVSVGVSLNKSLAKLASNLNKPSGLVVASYSQIKPLLGKTKIEDVWGIGRQTSARLKSLGISTVFEFAEKKESWVKSQLSKPYYEIWLELQGQLIYRVDPKTKTSYQSISHTGTTTPATNDREVLWARLGHHIELAFLKARRFGYRAGKISIFLKDKNFSYHHTEIKLLEPTDLPSSIRKELQVGFEKIYKKGVLYRAVGATISELIDKKNIQTSLFPEKNNLKEKMAKIYPLFDKGQIDFGSRLFDKSLLRKNPKKLSIPKINI